MTQQSASTWLRRTTCRKTEAWAVGSKHVCIFPKTKRFPCPVSPTAVTHPSKYRRLHHKKIKTCITYSSRFSRAVEQNYFAKSMIKEWYAPSEESKARPAGGGGGVACPLCDPGSELRKAGRQLEKSMAKIWYFKVLSYKYRKLDILDEVTQKPVLRAIQVSHAPCKNEFSRNPRSHHSWRFFFIL